MCVATVKSDKVRYRKKLVSQPQLSESTFKKCCLLETRPTFEKTSDRRCDEKPVLLDFHPAILGFL